MSRVVEQMNGLLDELMHLERQIDLSRSQPEFSQRLSSAALLSRSLSAQSKEIQDGIGLTGEQTRDVQKPNGGVGNDLRKQPEYRTLGDGTSSRAGLPITRTDRKCLRGCTLEDSELTRHQT